MKKLPFLTKGPFALFFGGKAILRELSNEKPSQGLKYFFIITVIFNLSVLGKSLFVL